MLQEVLRRDWMFKLVGKETFSVGSSDTKATINIDAVSGFAYEYTLEINGKSLKKYMENRSKVTSTWLLNLDGIDCRVVLGELLSVFVSFSSCPFTSVTVTAYNYDFFIHTEKLYIQDSAKIMQKTPPNNPKHDLIGEKMQLIL